MVEEGQASLRSKYLQENRLLNSLVSYTYHTCSLGNRFDNQNQLYISSLNHILGSVFVNNFLENDEK